MRHIITLFLALTVTAVTAQNDMKARALVEQTSKKMQSFQTLSASFTFTMENAKMKIKEQNSGSLLLKGAKYQVKLPDMGMQIFCDGKTVWNLMEEAGQVTVSNAGEGGEGVIDPTTIFNIYQEGYTFKTAEEKTVGGKQITYIEMVPQKNNTDYTKLTVGIDKAKLLVSSLVTHGKDGNLYGIYVNDIKSNQPVADTEFVFNKAKFPGIEVVDFREF
jgi:outer membrane lipoprotein-sorting protein